MIPLSVGLLLENRAVLLVGGGPVALGKLGRLLAAGANVTVVAPAVLAEIESAAASGQVLIRKKQFDPSDLDGMWLCLTATGRDRVDQQVFAACEARHLLCNAADVPESCSIYLMAQENLPPIQLAVGTTGLAPGLAGRLSREARAAWPEDIAKLVQKYGKLRRWLIAQHPGQQAQPLRSATLRWLAQQPWVFFRQKESELRKKTEAAYRALDVPDTPPL